MKIAGPPAGEPAAFPLILLNFSFQQIFFFTPARSLPVRLQRRCVRQPKPIFTQRAALLSRMATEVYDGAIGIDLGRLSLHCAMAIGRGAPEVANRGALGLSRHYVLVCRHI